MTGLKLTAASVERAGGSVLEQGTLAHAKGSGSYLAQWVQVGGDWRVVKELLQW